MTRRSGGRNRRDSNRDIVRLKRAQERRADARELAGSIKWGLDVNAGDEPEPDDPADRCARQAGTAISHDFHSTVHSLDRAHGSHQP